MGYSYRRDRQKCLFPRGFCHSPKVRTNDRTNARGLAKKSSRQHGGKAEY